MIGVSSQPTTSQLYLSVCTLISLLYLVPFGGGYSPPPFFLELLDSPCFSCILGEEAWLYGGLDHSFQIAVSSLAKADLFSSA